mgnify:CR=1 FL=1
MTDLLTHPDFVSTVKFDDKGLVPVIAQSKATGEVLMFAWMNRESLALTAETGNAVYWSRSRGRLWRKGEESGHTQKVLELRVDCDKDVVLMKIEQVGGIPCRRSFFFNRLDDSCWNDVEPVLKNPKEIYK